MLMNRRTMLTAGTALAFALTAFGGAMAEGAALKIGVPTSRTGPYTVLGDQVVRAVEFAVEQANANGGVAGHKVEMKVGDSEGNPDAGRRAAEELALDGYNVLTGTISSAVGLAIASQLDRWDAMYVSVVNKSPKLTGDSCHARMFRANHTDGMDLAIVKPWLEQQEEADWAIIAADYVWGRGSGEAFKAVAGELGKNIKVEVFPPLGTTDFAPYITQLRDSGGKGIWVALAGADAINFAKQAKQFGLTDQVKIFGHNFVVDQTLKAVGDAGVGVWGNVNYSSSIDTANNKAFVEAWTAKHGTPPTNYEGETYAGIQAIFAAVTKAGSVAPGDISAALPGLTFDSVFGEVTMRAADHQLALPNFLGRAVAKDGGAAIEVVKAFGADVATPPADPACKL